ncbi:hypothetical protein WN944_015908 [Citrus x changshan-huyou]|uniref:Uncharacterized protein n=1 Tax=Citrus x changshan-huyou TaxID=2935761 RepID=A0AAP0MDD0_9ROSI
METTLPKLRSKLTQLAENNASLLLDKDLVDEARDVAVVHIVAMDVRKEVNTGKMVEKWEGPSQIKNALAKKSTSFKRLMGKKVPIAWNVIHLKKFYA